MEQAYTKTFFSPAELRDRRKRLRLSQGRLAALSVTAPWKIARFELGELAADKFTDDEKRRIAEVFEAELARLRHLSLEPAPAA